ATIQGSQTLIKSLNGGHNWQAPQDVVPMTDPCYNVEPITRRCVEDGIAGARTDLAAMPSVDIANGAPTGADATDEIIDAWSDGRFGPGNEVSMVSYSTDGGNTWSPAQVVSEAGDRSMYSAPAISPDGSAVYLVYMALRTPFQTTTANP